MRSWNRCLKVGLSLVVADATALHLLAYETSVDNGITWTYTVSGGEASLGGGSGSSTAVSTSTTGALTIPSSLGGYPVTSIGKYAFYKCSGLTSVTIPDGVTNVGEYAFNSCKGLTNVKCGDDVAEIGRYSFQFCDRLKYFEASRNLNAVKYWAFSTCTNLEAFIFKGDAPKTVEWVWGWDSRNLVFYVPKDSVGWNGDWTSSKLPDVWPDSSTGTLHQWPIKVWGLMGSNVSLPLDTFAYSGSPIAPVVTWVKLAHKSLDSYIVLTVYAKPFFSLSSKNNLELSPLAPKIMFRSIIAGYSLLPVVGTLQPCSICA